MKQYLFPEFLHGIIIQKTYDRWLQRKAIAHVRRDRRHGNKTATIKKYKIAIHQAVYESKGIDAYTNEKLDWTLISTYENKLSEKYGREYKRKFDLLPSVDHIGDGKGSAKFKICSWRTNGAKSDLSYTEFFGLCKTVIAAAATKIE